MAHCKFHGIRSSDIGLKAWPPRRGWLCNHPAICHTKRDAHETDRGAGVGCASLRRGDCRDLVLIQSKVIKVWVYTDYAFRYSHSDWPALVDSRFREVNRIYQRNGTGVQWKVLDASQIDPISVAPGIDSRRANMSLHFDRPTDVYVIVTGIREGDRTGSVSPFTRVAVVEDFPEKSESLNARLLAHELAHLFGAPYDLAWFETLMGRSRRATSFPTEPSP